jgi:hypothetical protein
VVVDIHVDDDSVELANLWHNLSFCCFLAANLQNFPHIRRNPSEKSTSFNGTLTMTGGTITGCSGGGIVGYLNDGSLVSNCTSAAHVCLAQGVTPRNGMRYFRRRFGHDGPGYADGAIVIRHKTWQNIPEIR